MAQTKNLLLAHTTGDPALHKLLRLLSLPPVPNSRRKPLPPSNLNGTPPPPHLPRRQRHLLPTLILPHHHRLRRLRRPHPRRQRILHSLNPLHRIFRQINRRNGMGSNARSRELLPAGVGRTDPSCIRVVHFGLAHFRT